MTMDMSKLDVKTAKAGSLLIAVLMGVAGVAAHYLGHDYVSLGLIVLAALVIFLGSLLQLYLHNHQKIKDID
jgi:uncharacterized membrane protein YfcA